MTDETSPGERFLIGRAGSYRRVFQLPSLDVEAVLADLAKFCRAHETAFHADPRAHALLEGRREVWLRIAQHLNLSNDDLWRLYGGAKQPQRGT